MIGQTVAHYRIIDFLGDGETGSVYRAEDMRAHRLVAIRILSPEHARDSEFLKRLDLEIETVGKVRHPGIASILERGRSNSFEFIAMQLLDGETLESRLKQGPLPMADALRIATELAEALAEAHRSGVVHRHLKPRNVVLSSNGVRITGFGSATAGERRIPSRLIERESYSSPEQAQGLPADSRSDVFSLGVILYEMVTGRRPFAGENAAEIRRVLIYDSPEPPSATRPGIPAGLEKIIIRALAKPPADRYQEAAAFLVDLHAVSENLNAMALAMAPLTRRRRRHFGTLLPTVATIALLVMVWLLWRMLLGRLP
jgi:serine/threonine protein kinase